MQSFVAMEEKTKERWRELREQAAVELDREKLLQLSQEINRLLEEKEGSRNRSGKAKDAGLPNLLGPVSEPLI